MNAPVPQPADAPSTAGPSSGSTTVELAVEGMHCASCAALIEEVLGEVPAVRSASVDLEAGRASVTFDPSAYSVDDARAAITAAGYQATVPSEPGA